MDENSTNETVNKTVNMPSGKLFGWLAKYYDEEKYPPKPTPWFVYVLSIPVGFGLTWLAYQGMKSFATSLGKADELNSPFVWTIVCILFLSFTLISVNLYRCIDRYGFLETATFLPKAVLFVVSIIALGLLIFFFCISEYFGSVMVGIFWAILLHNALKKRS